LRLICIHFGLPVRIVDVINYVKFVCNRLRFGFCEGSNCDLSHSSETSPLHGRRQVIKCGVNTHCEPSGSSKFAVFSAFGNWRDNYKRDRPPTPVINSPRQSQEQTDKSVVDMKGFHTVELYPVISRSEASIYISTYQTSVLLLFEIVNSI